MELTNINTINQLLLNEKGDRLITRSGYLLFKRFNHLFFDFNLDLKYFQSIEGYSHLYAVWDKEKMIVKVGRSRSPIARAKHHVLNFYNYGRTPICETGFVISELPYLNFKEKEDWLIEISKCFRNTKWRGNEFFHHNNQKTFKSHVYYIIHFLKTNGNSPSLNKLYEKERLRHLA